MGAFPLEQPLFRWLSTDGKPLQDAFTIDDATKGVHVFGGTGAGKTSGSGQALAEAYLRAGFGGVVLTSKPEEVTQWREYCETTGRTADLRILTARPDAEECLRYRFNFLTAEARRNSGAVIENVVELFMTILSMSKSGHGKEEPFWEYSLRDLVRNAVTVAYYADGDVRLAALRAMATTPPCPQQKELSFESYRELRGEWDEQTEVGQRLTALRERMKSDESLARAKDDIAEAFHYWEHVFPTIPDRTRGTIVIYFSGLASNFLRHPMRELFCEDTTLRPEATWEEGAVIVLDLPVLEYHEAGRLAQSIFKYMWQRAVQARDVKRNPRPVFLFADENQLFLNRHDFLFQSIARSFRSCVVAMTQNLSSYFAVMGGEADGRAQVESLLGNFQTHIFHANLNYQTNQWAADTIGKKWYHRASTTMQAGSKRDALNPFGDVSTTSQRVYDYFVQPGQFSTLATGGPLNGSKIGAFVLRNGRAFATGTNYVETSFLQKEKRT